MASTPADSNLQRVLDLIGRRSTTDRKMGYAWMIVPVLPIVMATATGAAAFGVIVSAIARMGTIPQPQNAQSALTPIMGEVVALYGLAIVGFYLVLLIGALAFYYMLDRRNLHFARQQQLFSNLQNYLSIATSAGPGGAISHLGHVSEDSIFGERQRPAGVWAVLFLFVSPIVGLVVPYDLTHDLRVHEELQATYQAALVDAFREAGLQAPTFPTLKLHKRDSMLFIILSAVTAGLFWIYWFYTLLKDYNDHFAEQARFEDQLLSILKPSAPTRVCKSCGGNIPENARFCPSCGTQAN